MIIQTIKRAAGCAALWIICAGGAGPAWAEEAAGADAAPSVSGEVAFVTDYVYRGVSYSDGKPALQATATWSNAGAAVLPGLHVDGWVSTVDFGPGDPALAELWGTVGYGGGTDALSYDAGLEYAAYPGTPRALHYDYLDFYSALSTKAGPVALTVTARYSPDYSAATGKTVFADLAGEVPLSGVLKATAQFGYAGLSPAAGGKYVYWGAGTGAAWAGFTASLKYFGNDLRTCVSPCSDRLVFSVGRTF